MAHKIFRDHISLYGGEELRKPFPYNETPTKLRKKKKGVYDAVRLDALMEYKKGMSEKHINRALADFERAFNEIKIENRLGLSEEEIIKIADQFLPELVTYLRKSYHPEKGFFKAHKEPQIRVLKKLRECLKSFGYTEKEANIMAFMVIMPFESALQKG